jgi:hypothetical protein
MIKSINYRHLIARLSFIIFLSTSVCIYGSDGDNIKDSNNINDYDLMLLTMYPYKTIDSNNNKFPISLGDSYNNKSSFYRYEDRKTKVGRWISKYPWEIFYSLVALGTGITAGILNSKAKKQEKKEKDLYNEYLNAGEDSDFNKLWNDYLDANEKAHSLVRLRKVFSLSTGGICIAIYMSFSMGGHTQN